ncbi:MAG: hypothetical protein R2747_22635 [Pyrinomonadaceae bacterium]
MHSEKKINRVAIIGCRHFSAANLYSLLMNGVVGELVLVDDGDCRGLLEEVAELQKAVPPIAPGKILSGDLRDAAESDVAVLAAGENKKPGESRLAWLRGNASIIARIARGLRDNNFRGVLLNTTGPVDLLTEIALEESGLSAGRVIGSGKGLDAEEWPAISNDRATGETDAPPAAVWCAALTAKTPIMDYCRPGCPEFDKMIEADKNKTGGRVRSGDYPLFSVGSCVTRICEAILRDERMILPVWAMTDGQYGVKGVYLNLPCIIRRSGVEDIIKIRISPEEERELLDSAELTRRVYNKLKEKKKVSSAK